ncbi:MAG: hypothetical protein WKG07_37350 [Hymenobacter sp.]
MTLQRFASTGFLTASSGAAERIGFAENPFSRFFTRRVPHVIGDGTHEVERNLALVKNYKLKIKNELTNYENQLNDTSSAGEIFNSSLLIFNSRPRLYPGPADEAAAAPYAAVGQYVCLAPTSVWFTKQYPEEKWLNYWPPYPPPAGIPARRATRRGRLRAAGANRRPAGPGEPGG